MWHEHDHGRRTLLESELSGPEGPQSTRTPIRWSAVSTIGGIVLLADQIVKWVMTSWIGPDASSHRVEVFGRLFAFEYVENSGAAFGIFAGQPLLLAIGAVLATVLFIGLMRSTMRTHPLVPVAVGLVLGGAIGNLLDRMRLGYVVDFAAVGTFPRFNVADSAITIGLLLLAWMAFRDEHAADAATANPDLPDSSATVPSSPSMRNGTHA